ncbi:MAG: transglycosylase domain-containing protein [Clostridia bacterium]|nr:transglycosylase domain-containing protein [Clostridia bacterium]
MNKALKIILATLLATASVFICSLTAFFIVTADAKLQPQKLVDYGKTITVFDEHHNKIEDTAYQTKQKSVRIEDLNADTVNAFIASEDRAFYKHNGLNYKRMAKALYKNVVSRSFKEGASTISQQLIKNTHLTGDKTIKRKLKEIKLTKQLERRYSKDDILEMYLNTIYFGHNCFGLQNAAYFYFDKPASELDLEQSATLVGLLTSPNNYSPFKNPLKSLSRRNTVLKNMLDCSFINQETYSKSIEMPLSAVNNGKNDRNSSYLNSVFEEFEELDLDPYGEFSDMNIVTYMNRDIQNTLDSLENQYDYSYFIRNLNGGVAAFKTNIGNAKRQIGSTAKPIFVYAPAIEDKKIDLFTKINDEPINYGGYSPENYDKKYHGKVSVEDSIKYSYNVPAVKTLNTLNFDRIEEFAGKMGVKIDKDEKNLAFALGAMKEGITLKQLCDCYSTFANSGNFTKSRFIKEIYDQNGKIIYRNTENNGQKVFSEGTCSLINDALCQTAMSGTSKKLKNFNFDVACKTGTCGNRDGNTDAYSVAYTSDYCIGVWLGDKNNQKTQATGGNDCCKAVKNILDEIYSNKTCAPLERKAGTITVEIDREEYETNDKILICDDNCPKLNRLSVKCLSDNTPTQQSTRFTSPYIKQPTITVKNNDVNISLCQTKYYSYLISRTKNDKIDKIYDGTWINEINDSPGDGEYEYTVTPYFESGGQKFYGKEITLPRVIIRHENKQDKVPDIAFKDWYNQ